MLSKVMREYHAKDIRLDEQTRAQAFYTAMGAAIVKDLDKPSVQVRPAFHFLQERNHR